MMINRSDAAVGIVSEAIAIMDDRSIRPVVGELLLQNLEVNFSEIADADVCLMQRSMPVNRDAVIAEIAEVHQAVENGEIDKGAGELLLQHLELDLQDAADTEELVKDINVEIARTRKAYADGNISKRVAVSLIRSLKHKLSEVQSEESAPSIKPYFYE